MNLQPVSQVITARNEKGLEVNNIFLTIQGEGIFVGVPAVFVRLAGCNLQCPDCDTRYTRSIRKTEKSILSEIQELSLTVRLVVITGGEPLRQPITELAQLLFSKGYIVQVETNGTIYRTDIEKYASIIVSPKTRIHDALLPHIAAFKYVLQAGKISPEDGLPTNVLGNSFAPARPPKDFRGRIYVQPMDSLDDVDNENNLAKTIESCMKFGYTLGLQVHKIINME